MQFDRVKFRNNMKSGGRQALISLSAIVVALAIGMIIIAAMGIDPFLAMQNLLKGALGSKNAIAETLVKMTPLLFTGMSYALAARCGLTNLGMEGQLYMGALFSTLIAVYVPMPSFLHIIVALLAGFLGGAIWGGLVGWLKVRFGASELITTVMLNTIATNFITYMVNGPITEPPGMDAQSRPLLESAVLPNILPGTRAHLGIIIGLVFVLLFYIFLWKSKKGYEVRVAGQNHKAATYSGINTNRNILLIMAIAGGLAGLAGSNEVMGIQGRLFSSVSPGYGFDGIAVALIGANTAPGILLGAILFGILRAGGNMMQMTTGVPVAIISIIQGIVIIFVVACNILNEMNFKSRRKKAAAAE